MMSFIKHVFLICIMWDFRPKTQMKCKNMKCKRKHKCFSNLWTTFRIPTHNTDFIKVSSYVVAQLK